MSGNRARRRALETRDAYRVGGEIEIPLLVERTELITPELAEEMLKKNRRNRPINWRKVEEYADIMARGDWRLVAQGLVLDGDGNILTGQTRLWAVIYAGRAIYFRVSRGSPPETARLLDRGVPQSARDLAARETGRRHAPTEASIARAMLVLKGDLRPSKDALADMLASHAADFAVLLRETAGTKKTKAVLMSLAAVAVVTHGDPSRLLYLAKRTERFAGRLTAALVPQAPETCWGRGAAFSLAMERARAIVEDES